MYKQTSFPYELLYSTERTGNLIWRVKMKASVGSLPKPTGFELPMDRAMLLWGDGLLLRALLTVFPYQLVQLMVEETSAALEVTGKEPLTSNEFYCFIGALLARMEHPTQDLSQLWGENSQHNLFSAFKFAAVRFLAGTLRETKSYLQHEHMRT